MGVLIRLAIVRARLDCRFEHVFGARNRQRIFDLAHPAEAERDRARLAEIAAKLREEGANLAGGAVAIIGQRLHDHADAAGREALVTHLNIILAASFLALLDGALDIIFRHVLRARRKHSRTQARIHGDVGQTDLSGRGDFAREL